MLGLDRALEVVVGDACHRRITRGGGGEHRGFGSQQVGRHVPRDREELPVPTVIADGSRCHAHHALLSSGGARGEAVEIVDPCLRIARWRHYGAHDAALVIAAAGGEDEGWAARCCCVERQRAARPDGHIRRAAGGHQNTKSRCASHAANPVHSEPSSSCWCTCRGPPTSAAGACVVLSQQANPPKNSRARDPGMPRSDADERRLRFESLALPFMGALFNTALRLTREPQDAADLTQETFLRAYRDRKSTRLNSSHSQISYAVFCLKKKKKIIIK